MNYLVFIFCLFISGLSWAAPSRQYVKAFVAPANGQSFNLVIARFNGKGKKGKKGKEAQIQIESAYLSPASDKNLKKISLLARKLQKALNDPSSGVGWADINQELLRELTWVPWPDRPIEESRVSKAINRQKIKGYSVFIGPEDGQFFSLVVVGPEGAQVVAVFDPMSKSQLQRTARRGVKLQRALNDPSSGVRWADIADIDQKLLRALAGPREDYHKIKDKKVQQALRTISRQKIKGYSVIIGPGGYKSFSLMVVAPSKYETVTAFGFLPDSNSTLKEVIPLAEKLQKALDSGQLNWAGMDDNTRLELLRRLLRQPGTNHERTAADQRTDQYYKIIDGINLGREGCQGLLGK